MPNSKAHKQIEDLLIQHPNEETKTNPFWLHQVLFNSYYPTWRQYIAAQERQILNIVSSAESKMG